MTLSRRALTGRLIGLAAIGAAGLIPSAVMKWAGREPRAIDAAVARLLPRRAHAKAVGRAYLAVAPAEASIDGLRALLGAETTAEALATRVRTDFGAGRVVVVEGWTLSLTEARACALIALT
jgi:hypothetical protein